MSGLVAAPVVPVVISVGINPDHYITEDRVVNDTENTTIAGLLVNSLFARYFTS